ncbi:MAG: metal-dependent hydrolase [Pirellulales bacterium]
MPGFRTHITASTIAGATYAAWGYLSLELPASTAILAGGLCSVAGMLPDVDSDSSVPQREVFTFLASVTPMLMTEQYIHWGLSPEGMVLASAATYLTIRFGLAEILRRYTVHRGMWHSLPAALIAGLAVLAITSCDDVVSRLYKSAAVFIGFMSHLVLDELRSQQLGLRRQRIDSVLGSAVKLWRMDTFANVSTYAKLAVLLAWLASDPPLMRQFGWEKTEVHRWTHELAVHTGLRRPQDWSQTPPDHDHRSLAELLEQHQQTQSR